MITYSKLYMPIKHFINKYIYNIQKNNVHCFLFDKEKILTVFHFCPKILWYLL